MAGGGLVLRLRPFEKFLVNGVVIENGDRRARLRVVTQDAHILRVRDALHPDEVKTPARRLYYVAQLAVAGEADADQSRAELVPGLEALRDAMGPVCREDIEAALVDAHDGRFYHVMRALSRVLPREAALLGVAAGAEPEADQ
ncbi:MAG: flagellar biosynthesis repressor FlbT [Parvularculaceae bacterium]|nr:flagellar biosynthesis repressor FlbT [Parvularculaceae bacterium]